MSGDDLNIPPFLRRVAGEAPKWEKPKTEEVVAKIGPREQALREQRTSDVTAKVMVAAVDATKKKAAAPKEEKPNLDQALALAQGRTVDAAMLATTPPFNPYADVHKAKDKLKARARIGKLKATLSGATTAMPLSGKEAVALINQPEQTEATMQTQTTTAAKKAPPVQAKKAAKKAAPRKPAKKAVGAKKAPAGKKPPAKAAKRVSARPDGLREGSKQAIMLDMALRDSGATEADICKKLGWKKCRVTLRRVAEKVGAKIEAKKNVKGETVYFATLPKGKAS